MSSSVRTSSRHVVAFTRAVLLSASLLVLSTPAHAHFSLEMAVDKTHDSRDGDGQLKGAPCGKAGSVRGTAHVYTYKPGEVVKVRIKEFIPHPGYFRIAVDKDGDDSFKDPVSIKPQLASRGCPCAGCDAAADHCDKSDFYNTPEVLPGMDDLNPHTSAPTGTQYEWDVKMPDYECDNCTLQIIQVMEDPLGHGPYDNNADVYHQCIDIILKGDVQGGTAGVEAAGVGGGAGVGEAGIDGSAGVGSGVAGVGAGAAGTGAGAVAAAGTVASAAGTTGTIATAGVGAAGATSPSSSDSSGCSAGGALAQSSTLPSVLFALGLLFARKRKRF